MIKFYVGDIIPDKNTIFVFGSNPLGINGNPNRGTGGAALTAVQYFGVGINEKMNNQKEEKKKQKEKVNKLEILIENLKLGVTLNQEQEDLLDKVLFGGDSNE